MALSSRDIEILNYEINKLNNLIANFIFYDISSRKIEKITTLRDQYQQQLDDN